MFQYMHNCGSCQDRKIIIGEIAPMKIQIDLHFKHTNYTKVLAARVVDHKFENTSIMSLVSESREKANLH